jgi:hypothetical protein
MGSQDVPPRDVAEALTPLNLLASKESEVCPACGERKGAGQSLCTGCRSSLPHDLSMALQQRRCFDDGYDLAMLRALRELHARVFFRPCALAVPIKQLRLDPAVLTPDVLRASLAGTLCPKCGNAKMPVRALCNLCRTTLRANLREVTTTRNVSSTLFRDQLAKVEGDMDPNLLDSDPARYAQGIIAAIRWTRGKVFYHPQP